MLAELSSAQLLGWAAYELVEPFGETRADLRAGIVAATIANIHRKKDAPPMRPEDFMAYQTRKEKPVQSNLSLSEQIKAAFGRFKRER